MTLSGLIINIGIVAIILTLLIGFVMKGHKSWLMTFVQNFCGVLFLFSGWVKAVDPLGTAYKMEQYFGEFQSVFEGTWFSFLAPVFPFFSEHAIWFSVVMIIFEMVLGLMLLMGMKSKFTSWAFLLLVAFFTVLTGFTYLTGYVPEGVNFFSFGQWGEYKASNMKVTDCGCFGDFLKLEPKTSFFKDVFLLIPAIYFVFRHKDMHQLFTEKIRKIIIGVFSVGLLVYCMMNYKWNLPHADFRPFKVGADIRTKKNAEEEAMGAVQITHWRLKHKETGEELVLPNDEYLGNYAKYKGIYEVTEQIKDEPSIPITKISDFEITDLESNDITYEILESEEELFLIVNHKLYGKPISKTKMVKDSVFVTDTIVTFDPETFEEVIEVNERLDTVIEKEIKYVDYMWDKDYLNTHIKMLKPFTDAAKADGKRVIMAIGGSDPEAISDFNEDTGLDIEYGMADDILLKTIVRSNPGIVLFKDGVVVNKWHINKLPEYQKLAN